LKLYEVTVSVEGHHSPAGPIADATVELDGAVVGRTDVNGMLKIPNVTYGTHTIAAHKDPYFGRREVTISVPETLSVTLALPRLAYRVGVGTYILATGQPVVADLYIDGAYVGRTSGPYATWEGPVAPGTHEFRAKLSGYYDAVATQLIDRDGISIGLGFSPLVYEITVSVVE
jgi:hypothetical protein